MGNSGTLMVKYIKDENFWETPNLLNSYYAGNVAADGFIHAKYPYLKLEISSKDIDLLHNINRDSQSNHLVKTYLRKSRNKVVPVSMLYFTRCYKWKTDLQNVFNITPNKTHSLLPPKLNNELLKAAYIVGYIDGDGTIAPKQHRETIDLKFVSCSRPLLEWICDFFDNHFPATGTSNCKHFSSVKERENGQFFRYEVGGLRAALIIEFLRKLPIPKLPRKWQSEKVQNSLVSFQNRFPHIWENYKPLNLLQNENNTKN